MQTRCGLVCELTDREPVPVPLTGVSVNVRIVDLVAEISIEQRYVNRENQPIEATYIFPLDEGASVSQFTAEVDGRVIQGVVKETEEARHDYQTALQSGQSAFLLEEKLPDVFKAKVGNLAAGSGAKIQIKYITELKVEPDGDIRFYLPTTVAPRYIPAGDKSSAAADLASIKYTNESHYQIEFHATVQTASAIKEILSPTHRINVTHDTAFPNKGSVKLAEEISGMDRDLVLHIKIADPHRPRIIHEKNKNGTSALMLSLVPSFKLAEQKTELIFLVDRSGSMDGPGIDQARQALKLFLHSLPIDCYVNIAGFGFSYEELSPASQKYDERVLVDANKYAQGLEANLGGTEIFRPLEILLQKPLIEGYLRQIFVLTDGEVSNADQVLALIRRERKRARVFALGLGSSASHHLVEGIARAGNGTALFASLEERLEKKVIQQLKDALQPSLTGVKIEWDGHNETENIEPVPPPSVDVPVQTEKTLLGYGKPLAVPVEETADRSQNPAPVKKLRQIPSNQTIPPVFDGRHFVVYALLSEDAHLPQYANVIANSPEGPLTLKIDLNKENSLDGQLIHSLAAKKLIQQLQDNEPHQPEVKNEIIQLGCRYGLASRFTSYVAIDPVKQKQLEGSWMAMKSRDIPVEVAYGWGRRFRSAPVAMCLAAPPVGMQLRASPMSMPNSAAPMRKSSRSLYAALGNSVAFRGSPGGQSSVFQSLSLARGPIEAESYESMDQSETITKELTDDDKLIKLVSTQNFDGSFKLEAQLAELVSSSIDDIRKAGQLNSYTDSVWATAIALAYIELVLAKLEDSWTLLAKKANNWLQSQHLPDENGCKKAAKDFVKLQLGL